ncbi:oligosaccharide flippase family protein [Patulibacter minatonensis]|uniref:oligosaccharide flippase family protein n=1 Tax=Patulibacter minatonensis TaxID=298163 RepID=UPI00047D1F5A|nr:oligosaccharide flippase family protein [Patulibacter minatonensis]
MSTAQDVEEVAPVPTVGPPAVPRAGRAVKWALFVSLGVTVGVQVGNLATGVILARTLGPADRGGLTAVLLWPSLLAIVGSLGIADALTFHAARASARVGTLIGTAVALALGLAAVLAGIGLLIEPLVLHRYDASTVHAAQLLVVTFVPINLLGTFLLGIINGRQRLVAYQLLRGLVTVSTATVLITIDVVWGLTIQNAVLGYIAANAVTLAAIVAVLLATERPRLRASRRLNREVVRFGLKSHTSNVSVLLNGSLDQLLISVFLASKLLGLYTTAVTVSLVVAMIGLSVAPVALPTIAKLPAGPQRSASARTYISATFLLSAAVALPLFVFAGPLIALVFGEPFREAETAARILLAGAVVASTARALEAVLKAVDRPLDAGVAEVIALGGTAISLAVLLPLFGLTGAACASLAGRTASGVLLTVRTSRALGVGPLRLYAVDVRVVGALIGAVRRRRA